MKKTLSILALVMTFAACGPTVGDACTTSTDCGPGTCINRAYAPGGLCTTSCNLDSSNSCPSGTTCVRGAIDGDLAGCLRACESSSDCRSGYVCRVVRDSMTSVCVGPDGL